MTVSAPAKPRRARKRKQASTPALKPAPVRALVPVEMQGRTRLSKPTAEIIPFASYIKDASNRWDVHRYEIQELIKDVGNTYTYIKEVYARVTT
jgi:hypothetical protein